MSSSINLLGVYIPCHFEQLTITLQCFFLTLPFYQLAQIHIAEIIKRLEKIPDKITVLPCLDRWIFFKHTGKCYFFSDNDQTNIHQAKNKCAQKKDNAVLASIPDKITNDFLLKNVKTQLNWIGLERWKWVIWRWMDFTPLQFSNWLTVRNIYDPRLRF